MTLNYKRLYEYRFRHLDQAKRQLVWHEIALFVYELMGRPERVLDPAAGRGEFINAIPASERWAVDTVDHAEAIDASVKMVVDDVRAVMLPVEYFDGIFVSNFLEHLASQDEIADFLAKMYRSGRPGSTIVVMGPNFRHTAKEYFDCADHIVPLTHISVEEHLFAAGFEIRRVFSRFLPFSFRGLLPPSPVLTRAYLQLPPLWHLLGKQFLIVAAKDVL